MPDDHPDDAAYVISYPSQRDPPTSDDYDRLSSDGGGGHRQPFLIETRERLAHVESQVGQVANSADRIEAKIDGVAEEVSDVDDGSLDSDRFNNHFADQIRANTRLRAVLRWGGTALVGLTTAGGALFQMGML